MISSNYYNIYNWKKTDIDKWVKGLDVNLSSYFPLKNIDYDGKWLLNLTIKDLKAVGIEKMGHCILFLETVRILVEELHASSLENFQNVIFRVNCDATLLINMVDKLLRLNDLLKKFRETHENKFYETDKDAEMSEEMYPGQLDDIKSTKIIIISSVLKLMNSVKTAVIWMNKPSFCQVPELCEMKKGAIEELKRINYYSQMVIGDKSDQYLADIKGMANFLRYRTEKFLFHFKDSIYLTPCLLENVLIHKTDNMVFGINVQTLANNLHVIESIDPNTPAYNVGKLEEGDEILEINDQVIVGWQHSNVIEELQQHQKKLCLRLKKRPLHVTDSTTTGHGRRKYYNNRRMVGIMPNGNMMHGDAIHNTPIRSGVLTRPSKRIPHTSTSNINYQSSSSINQSSTGNLSGSEQQISLQPPQSPKMKQVPDSNSITQSKNRTSLLGQSVSTPATPVLLPKSSISICQKHKQRKVDEDDHHHGDYDQDCSRKPTTPSNNSGNKNDGGGGGGQKITPLQIEQSTAQDGVMEEVIRSLSLSPSVLLPGNGDTGDSEVVLVKNDEHIVANELPKIDDFSEGEYSAGENSPYVIRKHVVGSLAHNQSGLLNSPATCQRIRRLKTGPNSHMGSGTSVNSGGSSTTGGVYYDECEFISPPTRHKKYPSLSHMSGNNSGIYRGMSEDSEEFDDQYHSNKPNTQNVSDKTGSITQLDCMISPGVARRYKYEISPEEIRRKNLRKNTTNFHHPADHAKR